MTPELRQMVLDRDEAGLEDAFFEGQCPHFFAVDWRDEDEAIVGYAAESLGLDSLFAEWREEGLLVRFEGRETLIPLQNDVGDRHITICALDDVLGPGYEIRYLVFSGGGDTLGLAALTAEQWRDLECCNPEVVSENFIDPRKLPNLVTELTEESLPVNARARFQRMANRHKTSGKAQALTIPPLDEQAQKRWWKFW